MSAQYSFISLVIFLPTNPWQNSPPTLLRYLCKCPWFYKKNPASTGHYVMLECRLLSKFAKHCFFYYSSLSQVSRLVFSFYFFGICLTFSLERGAEMRSCFAADWNFSFNIEKCWLGKTSSKIFLFCWGLETSELL